MTICSGAAHTKCSSSDASMSFVASTPTKVPTSPGASDLITTQAAFEAFKGFDVTVRTLNPIEGGEERIIEGRLQERTTTDVVINVKGRMVKIPWHLVGEVRLPPAKSE